MHMRTVRALVLLLSVAGLAGMSLRTEAQTATTLLDFTSSWRYDQSGRDLTASTWKAANYQEDSFWQGPGMGILGFENSAPYPYGTVPVNTTLTISGSITSYYFRTTFSFTGSTNGLTLFATNFIDDGAVIYLNNSEIGSFRGPSGHTAASYAA